LGRGNAEGVGEVQEGRRVALVWPDWVRKVHGGSNYTKKLVTKVSMKKGLAELSKMGIEWFRVASLPNRPLPLKNSNQARPREKQDKKQRPGVKQKNTPRCVGKDAQ